MKHSLRSFISAVQFTTILPTGSKAVFEPVGMVPFFPMVGLVIGLLLCMFDTIAGDFWPGQVVAVLDVVFLVVVTGAFHLDGLADAADGLFSHRSKERALEIMKDSRTGVMGVVAVICGLAVKWGGISALPETGWARMIVLIIIPAYSRASMIFGIRFLEYGRKEGTGHDLFNKPLGFKTFVWLIPPVFLSLLLGVKGLWLNLAFLGIVFVILRFYKRIMGCITGDMLGAMTEASEALLFLFAAAAI